MKNDEDTIYIKQADDSLEELKNRILKFTTIQVRQNNDDSLEKELDRELAPGEVRYLNGGKYSQKISLSKGDYERLIEDKNSIIEDNKILGMEVIVREENIFRNFRNDTKRRNSKRY